MIVNALIGAVVTMAASFPLGPLGPVLGGGVAGYLEETDGLAVGALSGIIASLPIVLFLPIVGTALVFVPDALVVGIGLLAFLVVFVVTLVINGALGAVGGYLGVYVRSELAQSGSAGRSVR